MMPFQTTTIKTISHDRHGSSILVIYTGGTFGMRLDETGAYAPIDFEDMINEMNPFKSTECTVSFTSFEEPLDSSNMSQIHWNALGRIIKDSYHSFDGFVVLHGTDTMAYTSSALSFMLQGLNKPVIFTGAQLPLGESRSDARENLITALQIASAHMNGIPIVTEVCIYFGNTLLRANRSKKVESIQFDAFESENYPILATTGVIIDYNFAYLKPYDYRQKAVLSEIKEDIIVGVLKLFPGISKAFVNQIMSVAGLQGVVLETYGSGNILNDEWFITCLKEAIERDIVVVNVSQCPGGRVMQGRYKSSTVLENYGIISGNDITTEAAITKLMYILSVEADKEEVKKRMALPMSGEMI